MRDDSELRRRGTRTTTEDTENTEGPKTALLA